MDFSTEDVVRLPERRYYATIDGERFEYWDLLKAVQSLKEGGYRIVNARMVKMIQKHKVIISPGGRDYSAFTSTGLPKFLKMLEDQEPKFWKIVEKDKDDKVESHCV